MRRWSHIPGYAPVIFDLNSSATVATGDTSAERSEPPKGLDFSSDQKSMLEALNGLQWSKYPVHVNSWNPQSVAPLKDNSEELTCVLLSTAILVFKVWNERSCQGKVVVQHYIDEFTVADDLVPG
jgi:hypothetical protein